MNPKQIQSELDSIVATQAGLMAIVGSLMATHPQYERFQLHLTGLLEILLNGAAGITFTEVQRQQAREFVETLQQLRKAPPAIDPLQARLGLQGKRFGKRSARSAVLQADLAAYCLLSSSKDDCLLAPTSMYSITLFHGAILGTLQPKVAPVIHAYGNSD